jgi:hypothetical protein
LAGFVAHRDVMGWVLAVSMLFFSSLAFTVLENAMSVIFLHRVVARRRHFLVSAIIPYGFILSLGLGLLLATLMAGSLQAMGENRVDAFWRQWSLAGVSGALLYLLGLAVAAPCADRCARSRAAVGAVAPPAGVVLLDLVADQHRLRIADDRHRRDAQPGAGCDPAAARRAGDFRV